MREISASAGRIDGQPMFKLLDKARGLEKAGRSIIHLEIGDPDFSTPTNVVQAACDALQRGETHYTSSWGLPDFVEAAREATLRSRRFRPDANQVVVTTGANIGIFFAVFCLVNPGCQVLAPDPGFPTYSASIKMCGADLVRYPLRPENGFRTKACDIEPLITDRTRLLILNSPNNPTGAVTGQKDLEDIYRLAEKYDLYVYSDEIYSRMIYGPDSFFSISSLDGCRERVILSNGFSKNFAMTGWRLGVMVAPPDVAERFMLMQQTTLSCTAPFIQRAGIEAIMGDQTQANAMISEYKARRDLLVQGLNHIDRMRCDLPGGAFYVFADIRAFGLSSEDFAMKMLDEAGVALLPGSNFGPQGEGFVRLCYANSRANIQLALDRIKKVCATL